MSNHVFCAVEHRRYRQGVVTAILIKGCTSDRDPAWNHQILDALVSPTQPRLGEGAPYPSKPLIDILSGNATPDEKKKVVQTLVAAGFTIKRIGELSVDAREQLRRKELRKSHSNR